MAKQLKHLLAAAAVIAGALLALPGSGVAADTVDLRGLSSAQLQSEISGLNQPDAQLVVLETDKDNFSVIELARFNDLGGQGSGDIVERSLGCSTGCSTGCSVGCSVGCSSGCSSGCRRW